MPHLHTLLHLDVNTYANVTFKNFAQIYSSVCTNLVQSIFSFSVTVRTLKRPGHLKEPENLLFSGNACDWTGLSVRTATFSLHFYYILLYDSTTGEYGISMCNQMVKSEIREQFHARLVQILIISRAFCPGSNR